MKGRCLFIIFEFENWKTAKPFSYLAGYLFIDKLKKDFTNHDILIIPRYYLSHQINKIINGYINKYEYEEAFFWMPHININENSIRLLSNKIKKVNVILIESLLYDKIQISENPELGQRLENFLNFIPRNYKIFCFCPLTSAKLNEFYKETKLILGLKYNVNFKDKFEIPASKKFSFLGSVYNKERDNSAQEICSYMKTVNYKQNEISQKHQSIQQFNTNLKKLKLFDKILLNNFMFLNFLNKILLKSRKSICKKIHQNRYSIWVDYLNKIYNDIDIVYSLPSYFSGIPGKIFEAMICNKKSVFICRNNYGFFKEIFKNSSVLVIFAGETNKKNFEEIDKFIKNPLQKNPKSKYFEI